MFSNTSKQSSYSQQTLTEQTRVQLNSDTICLEIGQILVPQDWPPSFCLQAPIINPGCHLSFWTSGYKLKIPTIPSLGLIYLLEQLTELRKTFWFLDRWFIIKGYNSRTARWKGCIKQSVRKGVRSFHASPACHSSSIFMCSPTKQTPWTPSFWVLWRLHYISMID